MKKVKETKFIPSLFPSLSTKSDTGTKASLKHDAADWDKEHMMGTSIMAVTFEGGVVIGADSRTSTGNYVSNRASDKLDTVSPLIYVARSGAAADTQAISDIVAYYLDVHSIELGKPPLVKTAAALFQSVVYNNKDRLLAGIIVAGYDSLQFGQVYTIPLGGSLIREPWAIGGSGSSYIYAYCDNFYKPYVDGKKKLTRDDAVDWVKHALSYAMSRDGSSGGLIRMAVIDKDGVERIFVPGDKLPVKEE